VGKVKFRRTNHIWGVLGSDPTDKLIHDLVIDHFLARDLAASKILHPYSRRSLRIEFIGIATPLYHKRDRKRSNSDPLKELLHPWHESKEQLLIDIASVEAQAVPAWTKHSVLHNDLYA
jgi:hypothetical protein